MTDETTKQEAVKVLKSKRVKLGKYFTKAQAVAEEPRFGSGQIWEGVFEWAVELRATAKDGREHGVVRYRFTDWLNKPPSVTVAPMAGSGKPLATFNWGRSTYNVNTPVATSSRPPSPTLALASRLAGLPPPPSPLEELEYDEEGVQGEPEGEEEESDREEPDTAAAKEIAVAEEPVLEKSTPAEVRMRKAYVPAAEREAKEEECLRLLAKEDGHDDGWVAWPRFRAIIEQVYELPQGSNSRAAGAHRRYFHGHELIEMQGEKDALQVRLTAVGRSFMTGADSSMTASPKDDETKPLERKSGEVANRPKSEKKSKKPAKKPRAKAISLDEQIAEAEALLEQLREERDGEIDNLLEKIEALGKDGMVLLLSRLDSDVLTDGLIASQDREKEAKKKRKKR